MRISILLFVCFWQCLWGQALKNPCFDQDPQGGALFSHSLDAVPRFSFKIIDSSAVNGLILLTTKQIVNDSTLPHYNTTLQLIDPLNPYPPVWFCSLNDGDNSFLADCKIQPNGSMSVFMNLPRISFALPKEIPSDDGKGALLGYMQIDKKFMPTEFFQLVGINEHDLKIYPNGERLALRDGVSRTYDLSKYSIQNHQLGKETRVDAETIEILDAQNNIVFQWYPLDHMDIDEMYIDKYGFLINHSENFESIQYSRINSINIDPEDGNIIASLRRSDVCVKIDRKTGKIIWRLGGKKSDFPLDSTERFHLQHDFQRITVGKYKGCFSVFSNGQPGVSKAEGMIFKLDEKELKATLVERIKGNTDQNSLGQGNFEVYADTSEIINFGNVNSLVDEKEVPNFVLIKNGKEVASAFSANGTMIYRAQWLKNLSLPRPEIKLKSPSSAIVMPQADRGYQKYYWSNEDTVRLQSKSGEPAIYYKVPLGIGYVVSNAILTNEPSFKISFPTLPEKKIKASRGAATCKVGIRFNENSVLFRNVLIDVSKYLILFSTN